MRMGWLAAAAALAASAALAATGAEAVKTRQDGMKAMGAAVKGLNDGLSSKASAAELKVYADRLGELTAQSAGWFPAGSGPESGAKTKALPAIWSKPDKFADVRNGLQAKGAALQQAAAGGDVGAIRGAFGDLKGACLSCHIGFKAKL